MGLKRINRKRLWLLITVIWCAGISAYYFDPITRGYEKFEKALRFEGERNQETRFNQCLEDNGTSYLKLLSENREECNESVRNTCSGEKGRRLWCADEYLFLICIRSSSKECKNIYIVTSMDQLPEYTLAARWTRYYKKINYFMSKSYSDPLKIALLLFFVGPLFFAFIPKISTSLIKWLTT